MRSDRSDADESVFETSREDVLSPDAATDAVTADADTYDAINQAYIESPSFGDPGRSFLRGLGDDAAHQVACYGDGGAGCLETRHVVLDDSEAYETPTESLSGVRDHVAVGDETFGTPSGSMGGVAMATDPAQSAGGGREGVGRDSSYTCVPPTFAAERYNSDETLTFL